MDVMEFAEKMKSAQSKEEILSIWEKADTARRHGWLTEDEFEALDSLACYFEERMEDDEE